jgi:hypothetical protein
VIFRNFKPKRKAKILSAVLLFRRVSINGIYFRQKRSCVAWINLKQPDAE